MSVVTDPIADYLTRLRNASRAKKSNVDVPYSRLKAELSRILKQEGYIWDYELDTQGQHPQIRIKTKFIDGSPAITNLRRVSKPGFRRYVPSSEVPRVLGGMGVAILSTSRGVMTGREARRKNVGGELLALVW